MKKTFTRFLAALALLAFFIPSMIAVGQTTYNFSSIPTTGWKTNGSTVTINGVSWTYSSSTYISGGANGIQVGSKNNPQTTAWTIQTPISSFGENKRITGVSITAKKQQNKKTATYDISVGGTSVQSGSLTTTAITYNSPTLSVTSGNIVVTMTGEGPGGTDGTGYVLLGNIYVTYENTSGPATYTVTYNANNGTQNPPTYSHTEQPAGSYTVLPNTNENISFTYTGHTFDEWNTEADGSGDSYNPEGLNNTINLSGDVTLYAQWNVNTYTVNMPATDQYGEYTAASNAASGNFEHGSKVTLTYAPASGYENYVATWSKNGTPLSGNTFTIDSDATITVSVDPYVQPTEIEIIPNYTFWGKEATFSGNAYNELEGSKDNVTLNWTRGSGSTYANQNTMRFYKDNTLVFTAPTGYEIKSIVLTVSGTYSDLSFSPTGFDSETTTWSGSSTTVTMTRPSNASSYAQISKFTITIGLPSSDPSLAADDVELTHNATSGEIEYSITNEVTGAAIAASTTASWITLPATFASPITFTCQANPETTARTATVTLNYVKNSETLATKDVTITQEAAPVVYTTIPALYTAASSTVDDVLVTFNSWVVSGVSTNGKNVFVTDNNGNGFVINDSEGGLGNTYAVGNILSGTAVECKLQLNHNYAQLTDVKASDLTITSGGTVNTSNITMTNLTGVNTGALVSYNNLTCSVATSGSYTNYYLTDGTTTLQVFTSLYNFTTNTELEAGKIYNITGVYQQYNSTKEILPRSAADIEIKADLDTDTDFSSLTAFAYVLGHGPSEAQTVDIYCYDLEENTLTATAPANFEVSLTGDDDDYSSSVDMTPDDGDVREILYIRLVADKDAGDYGGNLVFTANNLDTKNVALTGTVTTNPTYAITLVQPEQATISDNDVELAEAGTIITLSYTDLDDCYNFSDWSVYKTGEQNTDVTVTNNQFTMPGYPVTVTATFTQKTFTVNYSVNGNIVAVLEEVNCGDDAPLYNSSDLSGVVSLPDDCTLLGWSTVAGNTTTVPSFTPEADATLYAVLGYGEDTYELVTNVSQLSVDDVVVIAASDFNYAMSTTQNTNNRGWAAITKDGTTISLGNNVCEFVLGAGNKDNTWSFYDGGGSKGYLYAASSGNNYLRTEATLSDNSSWTISISNNVATITAQGSNTRNLMQYNNSNKIFAAYASSNPQQSICLYKKSLVVLTPMC